ncbi:MAG: hypothetical protein ED555_09755 [Allomuricauda sp.]|nr:MAG: hypothetical protein ED555_09755 [Allomuricauda sp.]
MGLESQTTEQLLQNKKKVKIVLMTLVGIWAFLLVSYLIFVLFYAKEGSFRPITAIPFFIGPITVLPIYLSYQRIQQELKKREKP